MKIPLSLLIASLLQPAAAAGDVSLFMGLPGGLGSIEVHDEDGIGAVQRPTELQGIHLLDIELVGRTPLSSLDPAQPRRRQDIEGAARIELPNGTGSLYRFRRDGTSGQPSEFGFFLVDANGAATFLFEQSGTGSSGTTDPFLPKLAVAPNGVEALIATTLAAGGDLLEVDLTSGSIQNRTSGLSPQVFRSNGLALEPQFGVGATSAGVLRFDRGAGAQADFVGFPAPGPAFFQGDVAVSGDGSCVATLAGSAANALDVYCFGAAGDAVRVSTSSRNLTGAGYLPEHVDGPHLALTFDGSTCMWSSEETLARETWTKPVTMPTAEEQVTADGRFVDTLDTSGGILPYRNDSFLMVVGEGDLGTGAIENADVYSVQVDALTGVSTIVNVSMTSGDGTQPFGAGGTIKTEDGIWHLPGTERLVVVNDTPLGGGRSDLLLVDAGTGQTQQLLLSVRSVPIFELVGSRLAIGVTRRPSNDVTELYSAPADGSGSLALIIAAGVELELDRTSLHPSGLVAFVASSNTEEYVLRADVVSNTATQFAPFPLPYGPALAFTPSGAVALSIGIPGVVMGHGLWPLVGSPSILPAGLQTGQVLPR